MNRNLKTKGELMLENTLYVHSDEHLIKEYIVLLDNMQFIYELSLAELELKVLGVSLKLKNELREFEILNETESIDKN
ncbi:MAG: hypothetical protein N3A59_02910 [Thermodesulfovibrionales bacterium]|nr:hypothetical protein [Thermodesulfovibrionales bacterium]